MTTLRETSGAFWAAWLSRATLEILVVLVTIVGLALSNGGFFPHAWTVAAVALFWLVALALLLGGEFELGRLDRVWLSLLAALIGWAALSISWSSSVSLSFLEVRRGLVYFAALGAVLLFATRLSLPRLVASVWASAGFVVVYALLRYLLRPDSRSDPFQGTLLFRPLGYANALGILAGLGAVLAVGLTVRGSGPRLRMLAAASVAPFAAALVLTSSRGSALALVVGLAVMLLVDRERSQIAGALCILAPAAAVVVALSDRSQLVGGTAGAAADHEAHLLALWIGVTAGMLAVAPQWAGQIGGWIARLPVRSRALATTALAAAVIAGTVLVAPGWKEHFSNEGFRSTYWHVAWIEYRAHPWLGSGAGTFGDYWLRLGRPGVAGGALDAHNLYLETLAEQGPVALGLLAVTLGLPLAVGVRVRRQPLVPAALGAYTALLAHAALDWDWEMPAVMLAGLFCAAAIVACAREQPPAGRVSGRLRGAVFALAVGLALFALVAQIH